MCRHNPFSLSTVKCHLEIETAVALESIFTPLCRNETQADSIPDLTDDWPHKSLMYLNSTDESRMGLLTDEVAYGFSRD